MRPGRRVPFHLVNLAVPEVEEEEAPIFGVQLLSFPKTIGIYNLKAFDQIELYWGLWTMPAGASFVDLTLVGFRGWINGRGAQFPGFAAASVVEEVYEEVFLQLDTTNGLEIPFQARIRKTAVDPVIVPTDIAGVVRKGTRHSFPIEEDYLMFLIQTDQTAQDVGSGSQTLWGILGSE